MVVGGVDVEKRNYFEYGIGSEKRKSITNVSRGGVKSTCIWSGIHIVWSSVVVDSAFLFCSSWLFRWSIGGTWGSAHSLTKSFNLQKSVPVLNYVYSAFQYGNCTVPFFFI